MFEKRIKCPDHQVPIILLPCWCSIQCCAANILYIHPNWILWVWCNFMLCQSPANHCTDVKNQYDEGASAFYFYHSCYSKFYIILFWYLCVKCECHLPHAKHHSKMMLIYEMQTNIRHSKNSWAAYTLNTFCWYLNTKKKRKKKKNNVSWADNRIKIVRIRHLKLNFFSKQIFRSWTISEMDNWWFAMLCCHEFSLSYN